MSTDLNVEQLKSIGVHFLMGDSQNLLPYTSLCIEEFELIHEAYGVDQTWAKELEVSIGKGISYKLMHVHKEQCLEITLSSPNDCFASPLTIEVKVSHEPENAEEHDEGCPYAEKEWFKDEEGTEYWFSEGDAEYDEETDEWSVALENRLYEPECYCEWVEEASKTFLLEDNLSLDESAMYVGEVANGL